MSLEPTVPPLSRAVSGDESERYSAPALDKGLDVLELLSLVREPLTMGQIAERLSRSKGELFRMLVALERRDFIRRDPDSDRFTIGNRLFELAMRAPPTRNLVSTALPHIEAVVHELDQSCHLAVLSGLQMAVVARAEAPGELGFAVRIGYRRRLDQSTSGRVIAAYSSEAVCANLCAGLAAEHEDFREDTFRVELEKVRSRGYEAGPSSAVKGIIDIGAPVFGENGSAVAALTVPFIRRASSEVTVAAASKVVLREAAAISRELTVGLSKPPDRGLARD
jgi:DNA-binding IclR family transcriptional regulator